MIRIASHTTPLQCMSCKSNTEFYLRYVPSTDSQYNCHDWIFGSKLPMFRIIIYTCTKESTGRSLLAQHWWSCGHQRLLAPRGELTTMSCTISLVAVEGPWAFAESKPQKNKFSVGHSLRIIHIQAICSSTCNRILGRVPCEVEQLRWEVEWIPISINALIFSTCNRIGRWWLREQNNWYCCRSN